MKRIRFYVPVLAIAVAGFVFSTTSCVDDSESQSVTELREANAEKLKAEAAYQAAQAEVAKILAEAEAAKTLAEAELIKAQAKLAEAEAAAKLAENEREVERWNLEIARLKKQQEVILKQYEYDLAKAEAQLEQAEIENAIKLAELQNQLLEEQAKGDAVLKQAISDYTDLLSKISVSKNTISTLTKDIADKGLILKYYELDDNQGYLALIESLNKGIDSKEKTIKSYEETVTLYNSWLEKGGITNLEKEIAAKQKELAEIQYTLTEKYKDRDAKLEVMNNAKGAVEDVRNLFIGYVYDGNGNSLNSGYLVKSNMGYYVKDLQQVTYLSVGELQNHLANSLTPELESDTKLLAEAKEIADKAESEIKALYDARETARKDMEAKDEAKDDAYAKLQAAIAGGDAEKIAAAQTVYDNAVTAYNTAYSAYWGVDGAYNKYAQAQSDLNNYKQRVIQYENWVRWDNSAIENVNKAIAILKNETESPAKLEEAYYTAYDAYQAADETYYETLVNAQSLKNTIEDLSTIVYHNDNGQRSATIDDIKGWIESYEEDIADLKSEIADDKLEITKAEEKKTIDVEKITREKANLESKLEGEKATLAIYEAQAKAAKAIIDSKTK
ncbi:MAG: hypothetical protein LBV43_12190 [Prevotella sp.]|jgi:hypothetical protein|nr:hypothetical protein [Prevotella sp.]